MLRTVIGARTSCSALKLYYPYALPTVSRRCLATHSNSTAPSLKTKRLDEKDSIGAEGMHKHDMPQNIIVTTKPSQALDAPKTEEVVGDWVLFHPVYTQEELKAVEIMFREAKTFQDKVAAGFVKFLRWGFDVVTRYKHKSIPPDSKMSVEELRKGGYIMDPSQWLARILFLETTAAVPGMCAATLRHLRSLRLMKRDSGWIHTLLEEAENERMHLMTFMTIKKPSLMFRALILGAQGVFYNMFFFSYMISPSTCHRFVALLEEEAVLTYTRCIRDMEAGRLPEWSNYDAPEIAKDYWRLAPDAKLLDVMYAVRSDESTHRFVNHSLANLKYGTDVNPFVFREPDMHVKGKKLGFERDEAERYVADSKEMLKDVSKQPKQ